MSGKDVAEDVSVAVADGTAVIIAVAGATVTVGGAGAIVGVTYSVSGFAEVDVI